MRQGTWLKFRKLAVVGLLGLFLGACGGGGGGGGDSAILPTAEVAVILDQSGSGDIDNHFPMAVGNVWHFQGTSNETGVQASFTNLITISGTRQLGGVETVVFTESNPGNLGTPIENFLFKDANGIVNFGNSDSTDIFTASLVPYWEIRFPLTAGSEFVQLDRKGQNFGEDLDGDGINETADIQSRITVINFESVTVPAGTFANCAKIERNLNMTAILSTNGSRVTATDLTTAWFAPNVGLVKSTRLISLPDTGVSVTNTEELIDFGSINDIGGPGTIVTAQVSAGGIKLYRAIVPSGTSLNVSLTEMTGDADLFVFGGDSTFSTPVVCSSGQTSLIGSSLEDCTITPSEPNLFIAVRGKSAVSNYTLLLTPAPTITNPVNEGSVEAPVPVIASTPLIGQVATGGESFYAAEAVRNISILGPTGSVELHVFADDTYSLELDCTLRAIEGARECTLESVGTAFFSVSAGPLNMDGASYIIFAR